MNTHRPDHRGVVSYRGINQYADTIPENRYVSSARDFEGATGSEVAYSKKLEDRVDAHVEEEGTDWGSLYRRYYKLLSSKDQQILDLMFKANMRQSEIGVLLGGISQSGVSARFAAAQRRLKALSQIPWCKDWRRRCIRALTRYDALIIVLMWYTGCETEVASLMARRRSGNHRPRDKQCTQPKVAFRLSRIADIMRQNSFENTDYKPARLMVDWIVKSSYIRHSNPPHYMLGKRSGKRSVKQKQLLQHRRRTAGKLVREHGGQS